MDEQKILVGMFNSFDESFNSNFERSDILPEENKRTENKMSKRKTHLETPVKHDDLYIQSLCGCASYSRFDAIPPYMTTKVLDVTCQKCIDILRQEQPLKIVVSANYERMKEQNRKLVEENEELNFLNLALTAEKTQLKKRVSYQKGQTKKYKNKYEFSMERCETYFEVLEDTKKELEMVTGDLASAIKSGSTLKEGLDKEHSHGESLRETLHKRDDRIRELELEYEADMMTKDGHISELKTTIKHLLQAMKEDV